MTAPLRRHYRLLDPLITNRPALPVQRSAVADRPEHTVTGSGAADDSDG